MTIDFDSLDDDTVTIRDRDTMQQDRVAISEVANIIREKVAMKNLFKAKEAVS